MIQERISEIEQFLSSKGFTFKSRKTYCSIIEKVTRRIGLNFKEEELENIFSMFNLSPRGYNLYRAVMNFYTKKYLGYELTFTKAKVEKSLPVYVEEREFYLFLSKIPNFKHKIWYSLMYHCGLRLAEVVKLRKQDIDIENLIITVRLGKGKKDRRTIIPKIFVPYLKLYISRVHDYLFPVSNGLITERSIQERLNTARIASKVPKKFTCHSLRHTFAINLINKGIDIEEIRKMLGHSKLTTTQIYLQCKTSNLTEIAMRV